MLTQGIAFGSNSTRPTGRASQDSSDEPLSKEGNHKSRSTRLMHVTGDSEFADDRLAWDKTYARKDYVFGKDPADFLAEHVDVLPKGRALDIAMGEGRNSVFLAKKGFLVDGVDISAVGIKKAQRLAAENGVKIRTVNADLNKYQIRPNAYDAIVNINYLQRNLIPQIVVGLKKGGIVLFESYTTAQKKNPGGNALDEDFMLEPGELKEAFAELEILHYREANDGKSATARLIGRKR